MEQSSAQQLVGVAAGDVPSSEDGTGIAVNPLGSGFRYCGVHVRPDAFVVVSHTHYSIIPPLFRLDVDASPASLGEAVLEALKHYRTIIPPPLTRKGRLTDYAKDENRKLREAARALGFRSWNALSRGSHHIGVHVRGGDQLIRIDPAGPDGQTPLASKYVCPPMPLEIGQAILQCASDDCLLP